MLGLLCPVIEFDKSSEWMIKLPQMSKLDAIIKLINMNSRKLAAVGKKDAYVLYTAPVGNTETAVHITFHYDFIKLA